MWRWHLWLWWGGWWCRIYCKHGIKRSPDPDWPLCLRLGELKQGGICGLQTLSTKYRSGSSSPQQQQQQPYLTLSPSPLQHQATALHDHVLSATFCQSPPQTISASRAHHSLPSSLKLKSTTGVPQPMHVSWGIWLISPCLCVFCAYSPPKSFAKMLRGIFRHPAMAFLNRARRASVGGFWNYSGPRHFAKSSKYHKQASSHQAAAALQSAICDAQAAAIG